MYVVAAAWPELSAIAEAVTAVVVLVSAVLAYLTLRVNRRANQGRWAMDLQREWDEQLSHVRAQVGPHARTPIELKRHMKKLWAAHDPAYYQLLREPAFWDRAAVLLRYTEVSEEALHLLIGPDTVFRWHLWQPTIQTWMRDELGFSNAFDQFEWLAARAAEAGYLSEYHCELGATDDEYRGPR